jgi:hypothetical protein
LKVGTRLFSTLVTSHFPCPHIPGIKHELVFAEVMGVALGAGDSTGELPLQFKFNVQLGTLQGSEGISRKGMTLARVDHPEWHWQV